MQRRRPLYSITGPCQDRLRMLSRLTHHRHCPRYHYSTRSGELSRAWSHSLSRNKPPRTSLDSRAGFLLYACLDFVSNPPWASNPLLESHPSRSAEERLYSLPFPLSNPAFRLRPRPTRSRLSAQAEEGLYALVASCQIALTNRPAVLHASESRSAPAILLGSHRALSRSPPRAFALASILRHSRGRIICVSVSWSNRFSDLAARRIASRPGIPICGHVSEDNHYIWGQRWACGIGKNSRKSASEFSGETPRAVESSALERKKSHGIPPRGSLRCPVLRCPGASCARYSPAPG